MSTSSQPMRRVWTRNAASGALAGAASAPDAPAVFPTYAKGNIVINMNLPLGGGTLYLSQYTRGGTFPSAAPTEITLAAAGTTYAVIPRTAELAGVSFTNGAVMQAPEIQVSVQ